MEATRATTTDVELDDATVARGVAEDAADLELQGDVLEFSTRADAFDEQWEGAR